MALSAEHMVLRGSKLRNTAHVYGIVVFTGHDTKIMRNSAKAKYKFSKLEKYSNKAIALVLLTQFVMSMIASTFGTAWVYKNCFEGANNPNDSDPNRGAYYLKFSRSDTSFLMEFTMKTGTWIILLTNLVPIILMGSLEMVKFLQAFFI